MKRRLYEFLTVAVVLCVLLALFSACAFTKTEAPSVDSLKGDVKLVICPEYRYDYKNDLNIDGLLVSENDISDGYEEFYANPEAKVDKSEESVDFQKDPLDMRSKVEKQVEKLFKDEKNVDIDLSEYTLSYASQGKYRFEYRWKRIINGFTVHTIGVAVNYNGEIISASSTPIVDFEKADMLASIADSEWSRLNDMVFEEMFLTLTEKGYKLGQKTLTKSSQIIDTEGVYENFTGDSNVVYVESSQSCALIYRLSFSVTPNEFDVPYENDFVVTVLVPIQYTE